MKPGVIDARIVKQKLSKQLRIDLENHEIVHLRNDPVVFEELNDKSTQAILSDLGDSETKCEVQIKQLGMFLARISLRGGYTIPLRVEVLKR
jgi:hypothetical protein